LDGFVGAVVGGFEFAGRLVTGARAVVRAAVSQRPESRLWKNRRNNATWTPFGVRR
jgi:hypothetical protein